MLNPLTLAIFILAGIIHTHNVVEYMRGQASPLAFYQAAFLLPLIGVGIYHCLT